MDRSCGLELQKEALAAFNSTIKTNSDSELKLKLNKNQKKQRDRFRKKVKLLLLLENIDIILEKLFGSYMEKRDESESENTEKAATFSGNGLF